VRVRERIEQPVESVAERGCRERDGTGVGAGRHVEHVVVPDPDQEEARMELARAAQLRHRLGAEGETEDQELEDVAALHVAGDELAGDVLGVDLLEQALRVLTGHREVADPLVGGGAEAEAIVRAPDLDFAERPSPSASTIPSGGGTPGALMRGRGSCTCARRAMNAGALSACLGFPTPTKPPEPKPASRLSPTTTMRRSRKTPARAFPARMQQMRSARQIDERRTRLGHITNVLSFGRHTITASPPRTRPRS
jgi:hypothetical protein